MRPLPISAGLVMVACCALAGLAAPAPKAAANQSATAQEPGFVVLIDPAHGGTDPGARLAANLLEKDLTLSLSVRLQAALEARGITVIATRSSDRTVPALDRAKAANRALAGACIVLHATTTGSGVHLFTSSVGPSLAPPAGSSPGPFPGPPPRPSPGPSPTPSLGASPGAQGAWVQQSLRLSSEFNASLAQAEVPVTLGRTSLQPLDSLACPAVAIEVAPLGANATSRATAISDGAYQARIIEALAAAIQQWRMDRKR